MKPFRSSQDIALMTEKSQKPFQINNFLTEDEVLNLKSFFYQDPNKEYKRTGPTCSLFIGNEKIRSRIYEILPPCEILRTSLYFKTAVPHILHTDSPKHSTEIPYRAVLLPLELDTKQPLQPFDVSFFIFKQRWYQDPIKLFKGEENIYSPHNRPLYDYAEIEGLDRSSTIDEEYRKKWLPHLKAKWLEGLTIEAQFDWKIGSAIVFDSFQVHCASDFRLVGVESKLGLSIFTKHISR